MSYLQGVYPVTQMQELSRETYSMWISCPQMADLAQPGQFVHIKTEGFFLRRRDTDHPRGDDAEGAEGRGCRQH